jgi:hypothetical protein
VYELFFFSFEDALYRMDPPVSISFVDATQLPDSYQACFVLDKHMVTLPVGRGTVTMLTLSVDNQDNRLADRTSTYAQIMKNMFLILASSSYQRYVPFIPPGRSSIVCGFSDSQPVSPTSVSSLNLFTFRNNRFRNLRRHLQTLRDAHFGFVALSSLATLSECDALFLPPAQLSVPDSNLIVNWVLSGGRLLVSCYANETVNWNSPLCSDLGLGLFSMENVTSFDWTAR